MDIILLESINGLGRAGEVVKVKNAGYARNFLIPKKLAMIATQKNLEILKVKQAELEEKEKAKRKEAEVLKVVLEAMILEIKVETNDEGEMFGSVGVSEIAKSLAEGGHVVQRRDIILPEGQITTLGEFPVEIMCHLDVVAKLNIKVM